MRTLPKYKQNLSIVNYNYCDYVKSYDTMVAKINWTDSTLTILGYWSMTTSKHINYVAKFYNLQIIKDESKA